MLVSATKKSERVACWNSHPNMPSHRIAKHRKNRKSTVSHFRFDCLKTIVYRCLLIACGDTERSKICKLLETDVRIAILVLKLTVV